MPSLTAVGLFALAAFTLSIIPGPDMIYVAIRWVEEGRGAGMASVFGMYAGSFVHRLGVVRGIY